MRNKVIQVPVPQELLDSLDSLTKKQGKSRSAVIREACAQYITAIEETEKIRRYIQSYQEAPETDEEKAWAELGAQMAAENWGDEDWSEDYLLDSQEAQR